MKFLKGKRKGKCYFCGNLKRPEVYPYIPTDEFEMLIDTAEEFGCSKAHMHTKNTEYSYVIEGIVKLFNINENKEYQFYPGSFFVVEPYTMYKTKCIGGTKVLTAKVPGGDDKVYLPLYDNAWGDDWHTKEDLSINKVLE